MCVYIIGARTIEWIKPDTNDVPPVISQQMVVATGESASPAVESIEPVIAQETVLVSGDSMSPTITEGDMPVVLLSNEQVDVLDIVVIEQPDVTEEAQMMISGKPGDTMEINGRNLYRNGESVGEMFVGGDMTITLAEDAYWSNGVIGARLAVTTDLYDYQSNIKFVNGANSRYLKRVIGIPGDTIEIKDNMVYRNGSLLVEDYIKEETTLNYGDMKVELAEGYYWVMGDNRNHSSDSRDFGPVSKGTKRGELMPQ